MSLGGLICEQGQVLHMLRGDRALYYAPFRVSRCMCCVPRGGAGFDGTRRGQVCMCLGGWKYLIALLGARARIVVVFCCARLLASAAALFFVAGCSRDRVPTLQSRHSSGAQHAPQHAGFKTKQ